MAKFTAVWGESRYAHGRIRARGPLVSQQQLRAAGLWLATKVVRRTQDGKDEDGRRFKPYTPRYATAKNVSVTAVDLTRSARMLNAFTVIAVTPRSVRIGFADSAMVDRAQYNEEMGRRFLGVPDAWLDEIRRRLVKAIDFTKL